jgi:alkylation response protein AidB-like acyl-CoA dehydrogenase
MDFELTAEREFANTEIAPHVLEWNETQHFPAELLPHLAELGLMGVIFQNHGEPETHCRMFADFTP